jgi:SAM-dependent methyltransferase
MKLSDLVQFLNYLDQYDLAETYIKSLDPCSNISTMIMNTDVIGKNFKDPIKQSITDVDLSLQNFTQSIRELRQGIMYQVFELEKKYFENSTTLFNTGFRKDSVQHITRRTVSMTEHAAAVLESRLKMHANWQHPGLIFRPIHLTAFHQIVALDPMYLIDTHETLLITTTQQFNDRYQRRVRNYIIDEYSDGLLLDQLPKNQFGLVAAQNYLNFKPIEVVNKIITEVFDLLRPGGAFVFTYNNCDYAGPVKLVENNFTCYTPGRLVKQTAGQVGYVLNYEYNEINGVSILELMKPGHKISLRGGQTLAVIKDNLSEVADVPIKKIKKQKPPKAVDTPVTKYYTDEEQQRIRLSAVILGIDTEENIIANYTLEKLELLVTYRLNTSDTNIEKFQRRLDKLIHKRNTQ